MDILSKKPENPDKARFARLSQAAQRVLKRAAAQGSALSTAAIATEIDRDWIMVPTRKGLVQVAVQETCCFRV